MPRTFDAAPGITGIETMMFGREHMTSAYLLHGDRPALVETGPTTSLQAVLDGLAELGVGADDLAHIVVTHIHLDHAGGAGALAPHFPRARVWVHARGAPHLADPSKLVASATRVYGQEAMDTLFGPVHPVPADRLEAMDEGDVIDLGGRRLDVMYTPGHAGHHVCLVDSDTDALFSGDALGVFLPDVRILRPATPPPEFDLELAVASIDRVRDRRPSQVLFSHFGPAADVEALCRESTERHRRWVDVVGGVLDEGGDEAAVVARLQEATAEDLAAAGRAGIADRYELLSSYEMNARGIMRYLRKRAEAADGPPSSG